MSRTLRRSWVDGWRLRAAHDSKSCHAGNCSPCEKGLWRRNWNKRLRRADRAAIQEGMRNPGNLR